MPRRVILWILSLPTDSLSAFGTFGAVWGFQGLASLLTGGRFSASRAQAKKRNLRIYSISSPQVRFCAAKC
ncbi:hypothetical protein B0H11DRAFT_2091013 [Mycena galericulata]|nr:hypothetical protein B0H11DRAFT_2091013 [Mycena galericulata]